jgi:hypothetical protein
MIRSMSRQHTKPCKECPFRRRSFPGWLGRNAPKEFAILAFNDVEIPCHLTVGKKEAQCAGRAIMWANQCKVARDHSVPRMTPDRTTVFSHIGEFTKHHKIDVTLLQLMGVE